MQSLQVPIEGMTMNLEPGAGQINGDFIEMSGFEMDEAAEDSEPAAAAAPASGPG